MSVLEKLTEGIVNRDLQKEGAALLAKWENTGLLEGLNNERSKDAMARLLENQAKELLREASTMQNGNVEGFASVAFPIVRRVFGSLIANDLVSVQPMSLPSGLIFFLDFTYAENKAAAGAVQGESLYGGGKVGLEITGGIDLGMTQTNQENPEKGFYGLNNGYASPTASNATHASFTTKQLTGLYPGTGETDIHELCLYDPDIPSGSLVSVRTIATSVLTGSGDNGITGNGTRMNFDNLIGLDLTPPNAAGTVSGPSGHLQRRLTHFQTGSNQSVLNLVFVATASLDPDLATAIAEFDKNLAAAAGTVSFVLEDNFNGTATAPAADAIGVVAGASNWGLENNENIPEIDIKVDSIAVTAVTKKLKAKWTPELGQDLNAYHNLDAEVELTSILSEQIALEIDREILKDLVAGATAGKLYWSRRPGRFLDRTTGKQVGSEGSTTFNNESLMGADFTGTVSEWYETLVETINDVSAQIHRKTLRGGANFCVVSPEVANILEFTAGFRANVTADAERGTVGAVNVGSLSKKWDIYVDPYFPRNVVLVGRKGGSFLESGYVYAPYVPLQVTPTIFGVEDFVPRKGVMTRYAKKMVRPDMYGLVICQDLNG